MQLYRLSGTDAEEEWSSSSSRLVSKLRRHSLTSLAYTIEIGLLLG